MEPGEVIAGTGCEGDDRAFSEFRRKVRESELLSSATQRILQNLRFNGRLSVVVQNGRVLKSGYEEGYFSRRRDQRLCREARAPRKLTNSSKSKN